MRPGEARCCPAGHGGLLGKCRYCLKTISFATARPNSARFAWRCCCCRCDVTRNIRQIYHAQGLPIKGIPGPADQHTARDNSGRALVRLRQVRDEEARCSVTKALAHHGSVGRVGPDVGNAESIYHPGLLTNAAWDLVVATVRHRGRGQLRRARNYAYTQSHQDSATKEFRVYLLLRQKALYYRMTALTLWMHVFGPRRT